MLRSTLLRNTHFALSSITSRCSGNEPERPNTRGRRKSSLALPQSGFSFGSLLMTVSCQLLVSVSVALRFLREGAASLVPNPPPLSGLGTGKVGPMVPPRRVTNVIAANVTNVHTGYAVGNPCIYVFMYSQLSPCRHPAIMDKIQISGES